MPRTLIIVEIETDKPANDPAQQEITNMVKEGVKRHLTRNVSGSETAFHRLNDGNAPEITAIGVRSVGYAAQV